MPMTSTSGLRAAFAVCAGLVALPACGNECVKVAPASYSADRSISGPAASLKSKVYVSGGKLREESSGQAGPEIKIMSAPGRGIVLFNPETKVGSHLPAPPSQRRRDIKVDSRDRGDGTIVVTITADVNGQPQQISQMTCRKDGVLIEARHTIPDEQGNSKSTLVIRDSNIVVGPQPASLFATPNGIKFVR